MTITMPTSAHHQHCFYHPQPKRSTPIEIPSRHRPAARLSTESPLQAISPDLIFEMSPVESSPQTSFSMHYLLHQTPPGSNNNGSGRGWPPASPSPSHEPFMYRFPTFSAQHGEKKLGARPSQKGSPKSVTRRKIEELPASPLRPSHVDENAKKIVRNKVSRIKTVPPIQSRTHVHHSRRPHLVSPPPFAWLSSNTSSICSNEGHQWIESPTETDASEFDFEKYLIRQIEEERAVRHHKATSISSMTAPIYM